MFLTVEIRGAARLVRHSQGEDVSDPVADYECSEAPERPVVVARFDLGRMVREGYREAPVLEARGQRLPDPRVVAGTSATFTGGGSAQDGDDEGGDLRDRPKKVHERLGVPDQGQLLRMAQERPRRLLRRLYAESRRRGPLTLRFVRPLVSGRALVDISVDGPALHAVARLELSGPATTAEALVPPMALVLEVDAELRPTGDLDDIRTRIRGPSLAGGVHADVATRLGAVVTRLCRRPNRRGAVTRLLRTWLQPEPRWAVAVAEQLLAAPETLPLTAGHDAPARPSLTLTDILEQASAQRAASEGGAQGTRTRVPVRVLEGAPDPEPDLAPRAGPTLRWLDDVHAQVVLDDAPSPEATAELLTLFAAGAVLLDALTPVTNR